MDVKILVATHKPYRMPADSLYLPIHVGKYGKESFGLIGDDTGENISDRNASYCELTGIYWAWKNLNADYIGLVHYRRYFTPVKKGRDKFDWIMTKEQAVSQLANCDVLVPNKRKYYIETIRSHYDHGQYNRLEDIDTLGQVIDEMYPEYKKGFETVMSRTWAHMFNMFVMKKEYFDPFCSWMFDVLFEVEKRTDLTGLDKQTARVLGYLGEFMLDIFIEANGIAYKELPVTFMENQNWLKKGGSFLKRKFIHS